MLLAVDVSVRKGEAVLLDDVSIGVRPGEILALAGANGAGKSTLLKVLAGDLEPSGGRVLVSDRDIRTWTGRDLARARAVLPQESALSFPFTALEVVMLGRFPHSLGHEGPHDLTIARHALDAAGARHLEHRAYPTLSGGERQRVQFARALAQIWEEADSRPRYLLLDEPTSNLDLAHQFTTLDAARSLAREGVGVIAVLHDLNLAARYADRIGLLESGRLLACGPPEKVLEPELLASAFGMPVLVAAHPRDGHPLVIPSPSQRGFHEHNA